MKITASQKQTLKDHLSYILTYQETYNEFYDHISSGLEQAPQGADFELTMHNYITREFGGTEGLRIIEKQYSARALDKLKRQYVKDLVDQFSSPRVLLWAAIALAFYLGYTQGVIKEAWFFPVIFLVLPQFGFYRLIRYFKALVGKNVKRSVKENGFFFVRHIPIIFLIMVGVYCRFITGDTPVTWIKSLSPEVVTFLIVMHLMHVVTFYKMQKRELKVKLVE